MGKLRFPRFTISDDEEEYMPEEDDKEKQKQETGGRAGKEVEKGRTGSTKEGYEVLEIDDSEEEEDGEARPIGVSFRKLFVEGVLKGKYYKAFKYEGEQYELEDTALFFPDDDYEKPYAGIIKDIIQDVNGSLVVYVRWFYRPEEAAKKGVSWQACDNRELFYSFHHDEVAAASVMHKCNVHFVPPHKKIPSRSQNNGFIVQRVYDFEKKKLYDITDRNYKDHMQHEIDLLIQKTKEHLGELSDVETQGYLAAYHDGPLEKTQFHRRKRRKSKQPVNLSRNIDAKTSSYQLKKAETPGSYSELFAILSDLKAFTGHAHRDKWLLKLLQAIQPVCYSKMLTEEKEEVGVGAVEGSKDSSSYLTADKTIFWPNTAVAAITSLEKTSHEALSPIFGMYNSKMRQLFFNLKNNALLARRLLNKELEPTVIVKMSPKELKDACLADVRTVQEPEQSACMQMTEVRCSRCMEKQVGVVEIINTGGYGDRYQMGCNFCGYTWYASRDEFSLL